MSAPYADLNNSCPIPYAAGVIDGDGSIYVSSSGKAGSARPVISLEMSDMTVPTWFHEQYPISGRGGAAVKATRIASGAEYVMGIWRTGSGVTCRSVLQDIEPYLVEKWGRAVAMLQMLHEPPKGARQWEAAKRRFERDTKDFKASRDSGKVMLARISEIERLNWFAGLFEAEGCVVGLDSLQVRMNCRPIITGLLHHFGGSVWPTGNNLRLRERKFGRQANTWRLGAGESVVLLHKVLPFFRGADKYNQAVAFIDWHENVRPSLKPRSKEYAELRDRYERDIRLNKFKHPDKYRLLAPSS